MNKYKIIWSPKAYKDLQNIDTYIAYYIKEKSIANNIIKKILSSISNLEYLPKRHVRIFNYNDKTKNLRKLPIGNYVVVYEVKQDTRTSIYLTYIS